MIYEDCPICVGRGTKARRDGVFRKGRTAPARVCVACRGEGEIPRRRLQRLVRLGLAADATGPAHRNSR